MSFEEAVVAGLLRWRDVRGRASLSEFWWFQLFLLLLFVAALVLGSLSPSAAGWMVLFVLLGLSVPTLTLTVRRMHDVGWSGLWLIAGLFPFAWVGILLILSWPGTRGANRYGPPVASARVAREAFERTTSVPRVRRGRR